MFTRSCTRALSTMSGSGARDEGSWASSSSHVATERATGRARAVVGSSGRGADSSDSSAVGRRSIEEWRRLAKGCEGNKYWEADVAYTGYHPRPGVGAKMREMRAILLASVLPFADGLRPMVARPVARPALAVRPQACMNYAGQPLPNYEQQGGQRGGFRGSAGLLLSATGLVTTVAASTFALSASGTIAIIAASAAGLFSFKLSKELHSRGVRSRDVAKRVVGGTEAGFGSFPWMALVRAGQARCGGALIGDRWVGSR